jgi:hypothetical protein
MYENQREVSQIMRPNQVKKPYSAVKKPYRAVKKPYSAPRLYLYGDIREITRHVAASSRGDNSGAGGGDTRTLP